MSWQEALDQIVLENPGLPTLDARQQSSLIHHAELLSRWNQVHNLTRLEEPLEVARRHWADSFLGLVAIESALQTVASPMMDVGSGAGFPGIPAAVLWPDRDVRLVEAARKRASFLQRAGRELSLSNLQVLNSRQEDVERGSAALVVTRATLPWQRLPELAELVAPGGWLAAWVAGEPDADAWQQRLRDTELLDGGRLQYQVVGLPPRGIVYARRPA